MDRLIDIYKAIIVKDNIKPEITELKKLLINSAGNTPLNTDVIGEELLELYSGILGLDGIINNGHN